MSHHDIRCPYCDHGMEVCNDDGHGVSEDFKHEQQCPECEKNFVFTSSISITYRPAKADCLNGEPHAFERTKTYPPQYAVMRCRDCDHEKAIPAPVTA